MHAMVVNKHGSFYLRSGWGTKIIQAVNEDEMIFTPAKELKAVDNIGLGRVMVKALRYWADATGLTVEHKIQNGIREEKTDLFRLINENDRYFQKPGSLLLLHRRRGCSLLPNAYHCPLPARLLHSAWRRGRRQKRTTAGII